MDTGGEGILLGTAEDLEVAQTWLGGRTHVQNPWAASGKTKQALSRPQTRAKTTGRGADVRATLACEFKQFLCENEARGVAECARLCKRDATRKVRRILEGMHCGRARKVRTT